MSRAQRHPNQDNIQRNERRADAEIRRVNQEYREQLKMARKTAESIYHKG